ncbi:MAG: hypothetical protein AAF226_07885 [Verrucomicrobiota bacterium]
MTQITIRDVDEGLAEKIREAAKEAGHSVNGHLLSVLRSQFSGSDVDQEGVLNDLDDYRRGWEEDPNFDEAQIIHSTVDESIWK